MANIALALKEEITRLARRELRAETEKLKKASAQYRTDIAALKRRVLQLEKEIAKLQMLSAREVKSQSDATTSGNIRFSAKGIHILRERLELSAATLGSIFGLTAQTIYNWEQGKTRPSKEQLLAIAVLRKMSKKEVYARLEVQKSRG